MSNKKITLANKKLEKFLRKEKVFTRFVKNTNKHFKGHNMALVYGNKKLTLSQCFFFKYTPEEFDFWDKLNDKFNKQK